MSDKLFTYQSWIYKKYSRGCRDCTKHQWKSFACNFNLRRDLQAGFRSKLMARLLMRLPSIVSCTMDTKAFTVAPALRSIQQYNCLQKGMYMQWEKLGFHVKIAKQGHNSLQPVEQCLGLLLNARDFRHPDLSLSRVLCHSLR